MKSLVGLLLVWAFTLPGAGPRSVPPGQQPGVPHLAPVVTKWPPLVQQPFKLVNNLPIVQATVDGRSGGFLLDTGAEVMLLNQDYFQGRPTTGPAGAGATGAFEKATSYRVRHFEWQGIVFRSASVTAVDLSHVGAPSLLGLIGTALLAHYAVTLDYQKSQLTLRAPGAPAPATKPRLTLPFVLRGHLPVIPVTIAGREYELAIDSGASVNMLNDKHFTTLTAELAKPFTTALGGAASRVRAVRGGTIQQATLGKRLPLANMVTIFTTIKPLTKGKFTSIDGILGYEFLRQYQVTINYPKGVVELRWEVIPPGATLPC